MVALRLTRELRAGDVTYMLHTVGMYIAGVRMWAKAPEGFPARSTARTSELHSRKEGACDVDSRARPTRKEKAPVASVSLETWPGGCVVTSAECCLRKRGAGAALDAREPARCQGRDGGRENTSPAPPDSLRVLGSHVP